MSKKRTNWHEAAVCAIQITLRDYDHMLEYFPEYSLVKNSFRIDLLIIRKFLDKPIPHSIAQIFQSYNLWEIKGIHSSVTVQSYYKAIAYATLLIINDAKALPHDRNDISLSFLCHKYPRKLIKHLTEECEKTVANTYPGIYYIKGDFCPVQIIVSNKLPPREALYLRCLTDRLTDSGLAEQLAEDYAKHLNQAAYEKYMNQLVNANLKEKGDEPMAICCEGIFRLYGTSYKEAEESGARKVQVQLDQVTEKLNETTQELNNTTQELHQFKTENEYLKKLLDEHGIAYT